MNKSSEKKLSCTGESFFGETTMDFTFENDKLKDIDGSMVFVFDSEEEANNADEQLEYLFGDDDSFVIDKIEGTKVTVKMSEEDKKESMEEYDGMSYDEVKTSLESMGAVCK